MMSRLKSGLSRERWQRGWERGPELCQVCIHTHHVSEWAFYITLNLDQMAYTQWAAAHGYWDIVICSCVLVCVCLNIKHVCLYMCGSMYVCLSYLLLPYVWAAACKLCASVFVFMSVFVHLCVLVFVRVGVCVFVCVHECKSVALWPVDTVLLLWQRAQFSPSQSLSGFQLLTAAGQQPAALIAQYEMHISCLCSLYLIVSHSFWFMP